MAPHLPNPLRRLVGEPAGGRCEYCQLPYEFALHPHEPDHIVPLQHGGLTREDNLALACFRCNRHKGPNVGSFDASTGILVPFYNPRTQVWSSHFAWNGAELEPLTPEARVAVRILRLDSPHRVEERLPLMSLGVWA